MKTPGIKGQQHNDTKMRTIQLPPRSNLNGWNIEEYKNRWDIIEKLLK
jgi:hypothetical protein